MITAGQKAALDKKRAEKKEKEAQDSPAEKREVVMHGASLKCMYAQGLGKLVVTSNELLLQDQKWATEGDGNNMVNLQFAGTCGHPKWPQRNMTAPPCMAVIKLSPWQKLGTNYLQEQKNLVKESYIECEPEFNVATASQVPQTASIETIVNRVTSFERLSNAEMDLFTTARFRVTGYAVEPAETRDRAAVRWAYELNGQRHDITRRGEILSLYVGIRDAYDTSFKVFAYLNRINESLFQSVRVRRISIRTRASWGARDHQTGSGYSYDQIVGTPADYYDTIVIHHSGNALHFPTIAQIQNEHMDDMDKADIGYHFAVDEHGVIFEGRPINIKGAHVNNANTGKIGIVLLADLSTDNAGISWPGSVLEERDGDDSITNLMEKSLLRLCIHLDRLYGINVVAGHREIAESAETDERFCPGNLTMAKMSEWRRILGKTAP